MTDQAELRRIARGAWHLLQSLLAVREGATDEGIREMANALDAAIRKSARADALTDGPHDFAVHVDGTPAATPGGVRARAAQHLAEGDIIAVILRAPSGQLSLQAYEPPTRELLERLMELAQGYRRLLRGH